MPTTELDGTVVVQLYIFRMLVQKYGFRAAVEINEIQQGFHAESVSGRDKVFQILIGPVFGVHMVIILEPVRIFGIFKAGFVLTVAPVGLIHVVIGDNGRTEVNNVDSESGKVREQFFRRFQSSFQCERA